MEKRVQILKKGKMTVLAFFISESPKERLKNLEKIRREINNQQYDTQQGFQRVYRIIKRS